MTLRILEYGSASYAPRTRYNARTADVTVAFAVDPNTRGEQLTQREARGRYALVEIDVTRGVSEVAEALIAKLEALEIPVRILNVAGNSLHTLAKHGLGQSRIDTWVHGVLTYVHRRYRLEHVLCGGQTGVDIAGAVGAVALGIPVTVSMPVGFIQRGADGTDRAHTREEVEAQVRGQVRDLDLSVGRPRLVAVAPAADTGLDLG
jgi:hypothetical protein